MLLGCGLGPSEQRLQLGKDLLDCVQVRRVGWQVEQASAGGLNRLAHTGNLVGGEVIEDKNIALGEGGHEELPDIGEEGLAGHRPVKHKGCDEAGAAQASAEGGGVPVAVRRHRLGREPKQLPGFTDVLTS